MSYPYTERVAQLFLGRVLDDPSVNHNQQRFCVSLEATSLATGEKGKLPITPSFHSLDALEEFCQNNWLNYLNLDSTMRETGAIPPMHWGEGRNPSGA